jgi:hypothetical protein
MLVGHWMDCMLLLVPIIKQIGLSTCLNLARIGSPHYFINFYLANRSQMLDRTFADEVPTYPKMNKSLKVAEILYILPLLRLDINSDI